MKNNNFKSVDDVRTHQGIETRPTKWQPVIYNNGHYIIDYVRVPLKIERTADPR